MPQFNTNCLCANCQRLNTYLENPRGASCKEPVAGAKLPLPWVGGAVVVAKGWLEVERVVEADELPANLFEVAAMGRTGEHAGDGVQANGGKEGGVLDGREQLNLLRRGQRCKAGCVREYFFRLRL